MESCLKNGDVLARIISAIGDLVTDANFDCNEDGISLQAMDSSHVSLVSMLLQAEGFEPWKCDQTFQLGIHLAHLMKLLRCMHVKDSVELIYKENSEQLDFIFKSQNEERVAHFSLNLMEIEAERLGIPKTEYNTCVQMPSSEFMRVCRDLASFGDTVTIKVTKDEISFSAMGDMGNGTMSLRNSTANGEEDPEFTFVKSKDDISQDFALRYLQHFTKATSLSAVVTLRMSENVPLQVEYGLDDMGYLRYYLAPKINEE